MNWQLTIHIAESARGPLASLLFELGALGVEERPEGLAGFFAAGQEPEALRTRVERFLDELTKLDLTPRDAWILKLEPLPDVDWQAAWKTHWRPQEIGARLRVCPSWIEPEDDGRLLLRLDPGSAFGTGTHESTRLLLEWLDGLGELGGLNVLDAGCGTGILALAALKLGAAFALGIDIDPEAVRCARENARLNGCRTASHFIQGDPRGLDERMRFDLVLANIQRSVIEDFFPDLLRVTRPGGRLLLAGLLETEEEAVRALAAEWRLGEPEWRRQGEWLAAGLARPLDCEV